MVEAGAKVDLPGSGEEEAVVVEEEVADDTTMMIMDMNPIKITTIIVRRIIEMTGTISMGAMMITHGKTMVVVEGVVEVVEVAVEVVTEETIIMDIVMVAWERTKIIITETLRKRL